MSAAPSLGGVMGGAVGVSAPPPPYMQPSGPVPDVMQQVGAIPGLAPPTTQTEASVAAFSSLVPSLDPAKAAALDSAQQQRLEEHRARALEREREKQELEATMRANQERERFYQTSMKELVMFKSRVDAALVDLQNRSQREEGDFFFCGGGMGGYGGVGRGASPPLPPNK